MLVKRPPYTKLAVIKKIVDLKRRLRSWTDSFFTFCQIDLHTHICITCFKANTPFSVGNVKEDCANVWQVVFAGVGLTVLAWSFVFIRMGKSFKATHAKFLLKNDPFTSKKYIDCWTPEGAINIYSVYADSPFWHSTVDICIVIYKYAV